MKNLEKLIMEFCPDGVEYVNIGDVVNYKQPTEYIVKSTDYKDEYTIPVLTAGQTFLLGYTNEEDGIFYASKDNPVIIFDDFTGAFKWVDFPFKVKSSAIKILMAGSDRIILRYIFHLMGNIDFSSDEHKRLWIGIYSTFKIPVPPLVVQNQIVHILDNFTALTAELTAALTAELIERKKQYEYYREQILSFGSDVKKYSVKEICDTITNFAAAGSFAEVAENVPYLSEPDYAQLIRTVDIKSHYTNKSPIYISKQSFEYLWRVNLDSPSIVLPSVGNCGEVYYLDPVDLPYEHNALAKNALLVRSSKANMKFLRFIFESVDFQRQLAKVTSNMGQSKFNKKDFEKILIPIPNSIEQERVVTVLERFETLCNDISTDLPVEIEARQGQYEYYRDKLLTFKEKGH